MIEEEIRKKKWTLKPLKLGWIIHLLRSESGQVEAEPVSPSHH